MTGLRLSHPTGRLIGRVAIPGSKSESNRLLLLQALYAPQMLIDGLSTANDTVILKKMLKQFPQQSTLSAQDAGTAMRFMTAYLASQKGEWFLDGSARMRERPIKVLVDALEQLGAKIEYVAQAGYPPIKIWGSKLSGGKLAIDASVSSQFISALMMIAPGFDEGLQLNMEGFSVSTPYIYLTANIMRRLGIPVRVLGTAIGIDPLPDNFCPPEHFSIEPDWSAASYWYAMGLLAQKTELYLPGFRQHSLQGDALVGQFFAPLGVESHFIGAGFRLRQGSRAARLTRQLNLAHNPDLAQTMAVVYAALGEEVQLKGLQTLRIKETDRLRALKTELEKTGAVVKIEKDQLRIERGVQDLRGLRFQTYQDHRMAMALAPLALLAPIEIEDPEVVVKSYGSFWKDLGRMGFVLEPA